MRDLDHYLQLFAANPGATIGRQIVALAIYAGRYGGADDPDTLREIVRALPEDMPAADAAEIARRLSDWRAALTEDPIPAWALKSAISHRGLTQAEFASQMGVTLRAAQHWVGGTRPCSGASATLARIILQKGAK